jgi:hypothetical protein
MEKKFKPKTSEYEAINNKYAMIISTNGFLQKAIYNKKI